MALGEATKNTEQLEDYIDRFLEFFKTLSEEQREAFAALTERATGAMEWAVAAEFVVSGWKNIPDFLENLDADFAEDD